MNARDRERLAEKIARSRARVVDLERERDVELMRIAESDEDSAPWLVSAPTSPSAPSIATSRAVTLTVW